MATLPNDTEGLAKSYANDPHCEEAVEEAKKLKLVPGTPRFMSFVIGFINKFPYEAPPEAFSDGSIPGRRSPALSEKDLLK